MSHNLPLQTPRLLLRELTPDDVPALAVMLADPEVMRFSVRGVMSQQATAEFVQWCIHSYAANGFGPWAVVEKSSGQLAGFCGLNAEQVDGADEIGIGYRLAPSFWGRGLATEAVRATLAHCFDALNIGSVIAIVEPANLASIKVIHKAGFTTYIHSQYHRRGVRIYRLGSPTLR